MGAVLVVILVVPLVTSVSCWWVQARLAKALTLASGAATFALSIVLLVSGKVTTALSGWLRVDALSVVFLLAVGLLYASTTVFAIGYVQPGGDPVDAARYSRRFFAGLNLFAWAMAMAPVVNGLALLWVAIEVTTVVSALLVAIDDTDGAIEAAWKYVLIASMGLGIALLATLVMYYAGTAALGGSYEPFYPTLLGAAHRFPPEAVRLSFGLAVLGYGSKMGLVPMHTWLPDAHSEAPTPISALLSGALLTVSFYAILRFYQVSVRAIGPAFPRDVLLVFGLASLVLAALYLASQRDLKRLLAYSSIEHMGILAIGMSFSAPIAVVGVLLHVLAHAAAKSTAFFGAGSVIRKFGTKELARVRGGVSALPWSGPMLLLAVLALGAMPPFGIFRSEFLIVEGGLRDPATALSAVLVVLVTVAFLGLSWYASQTMLTPTPEGVVRGETSAWMAGSMAIGIGALVVLGVHPPAQLSDLLTRAAAELGGTR
ncbi:MAG: proton-conducting transporter membrane subunit [Acidimicrobiales bacterium]|jgi:hydrogenase-4 component F